MTDGVLQPLVVRRQLLHALRLGELLLYLGAILGPLLRGVERRGNLAYLGDKGGKYAGHTEPGQCLPKPAGGLLESSERVRGLPGRFRAGLSKFLRLPCNLFQLLLGLDAAGEVRLGADAYRCVVLGHGYPSMV